MKKLTDETAIAQQLVIEYLDTPMIIPEMHSGGKPMIFDIENKQFQIQLYNFNYKEKGMARGLWLLGDLVKSGLKQCQIGIRLV